MIDDVWKCGIAKVCSSLGGCCKKAVASKQTRSAYFVASYKRYLIPRMFMSKRNLVKKQPCEEQMLQTDQHLDCLPFQQQKGGKTKQSNRGTCKGKGISRPPANVRRSPLHHVAAWQVIWHTLQTLLSVIRQGAEPPPSPPSMLPPPTPGLQWAHL